MKGKEDLLVEAPSGHFLQQDLMVDLIEGFGKVDLKSKWTVLSFFICWEGSILKLLSIDFFFAGLNELIDVQHSTFVEHESSLTVRNDFKPLTFFIDELIQN